MQPFSVIYDRAIARKGSKAAIEAQLPEVLASYQIQALGDDRFLAEMTRCIFQAGFVWRVINQKWPNFEAAFFNFDPQKMVLLSPEQLERIGQNEAIVRNMQKILTVPANAQYILDCQLQHGSFSQMVGDWATNDVISLLKQFKDRGSRLGGNTGQRVLRNLGIDTFILSKDVLQCLSLAGVDLSKSASSQRDLVKVQNAFNEWQQETSLPLAHLSRIASMSVGDNLTTEQLNRHDP